MHRSFAYRSYLIWRDGKHVVAAPLDDEDGAFEIAGSSIDEVISLIDETWEALDKEPEQRSYWIRRLPSRTGRIHPARRARIVRRLAPFAAVLALAPAVGYAIDRNSNGVLDRREIRPLFDVIIPAPKNVVAEGPNGEFYDISVVRHPTRSDIDFKLLSIETRMPAR